jgi:uncharacterized repeat protein (TIGR01451 family)
MRIRAFVLVVLLGVLALPAAAGADTTLGITTQPTGSTAAPCPVGPTPPANELMFEFGPGGPVAGPLTVPSSPTSQALSSWAVNATGVTADEQLTLVVFQLALGSEPTATIIATDTETVTPPTSAADDVEQFTLAQPIAVASGDDIGQYAPGTTPGLTCYWSGGPSQTNEVIGADQSTPPTAGEQSVLTGTGISSGDSDLNLQATLAPRSYDAGVSLSSGPSGAVVGQPAVLSATITNHGPLGGPITFTDPVPSGLTVESASVGSGGCTVSAGVNIVTCTSGSLAVGQSTPVVIVVEPTAAQSYQDSATVSVPGGTDPNPANNTTSTTLTVSKVPAPPKCVVPKLSGATLAFVKQVLPLLDCKVGKVKKATSKSVAKGDVISTNPRAGSYAAGKSIGVTVSSGKPKPKPKPNKKKKK